MNVPTKVFLTLNHANGRALLLDLSAFESAAGHPDEAGTIVRTNTGHLHHVSQTVDEIRSMLVNGYKEMTALGGPR